MDIMDTRIFPSNSVGEANEANEVLVRILSGITPYK